MNDGLLLNTNGTPPVIVEKDDMIILKNIVFSPEFMCDLAEARKTMEEGGLPLMMMVDTTHGGEVFVVKDWMNATMDLGEYMFKDGCCVPPGRKNGKSLLSLKAMFDKYFGGERDE